MQKHDKVTVWRVLFLGACRPNVVTFVCRFELFEGSFLKHLCLVARTRGHLPRRQKVPFLFDQKAASEKQAKLLGDCSDKLKVPNCKLTSEKSHGL